ncbi:anhydro-N-acetylmuramic acid kinase [Oleiagrimonas soli]|uniref:Anhydro-N-acetylmuramic acid kinase n=1 Tax=Oleiagrimonas soli TaxID=1543381 RepID=A0A099D1M3_9GAMM|nr:anhydro-N-acetylmuramic acid kinase [Oleiagrimonas soli]KGI79215.1 anhydro-N-acetylmuramic acid kinase [Oleiagrimonas soli]MBB6184899.1 anhydro-N-acetylmuramic acid kinase [Oleiagrimonas soli]
MSDTEAALYVGLISGTSADGIDAALCRFQPHTELIHARTHLWPDALREDILDVSQGNRLLDLDAYGRLDVAIGQCFAEAVQRLLQEADVLPAAVRAIGSHGQTVRHRIGGKQPFTLQIGDPSVIAERTSIDTVADFRRADVAAGGQGAPLMPAFHAAVLGTDAYVRGVLNLGGIANLSVLHPDGRVIGFDTGPANGLMDAWCAQTYHQPFDRDGAIAAGGTVDEALLEALLNDPYFALPAPKSTGREVFHLDWLRAHGDIDAMAPADVQATLLELTVRSVADAVRREAAQADDLIVCGGGVHNRALMDALAKRLAPCRVVSSETLGVAPDHVESMGFAWLAYRRLRGEPGNLPSVTGAAGLRLLGAIHAAPRR